jgi:hypothetical protein
MAGRPRIYDSPDELESQCDKYFDECLELKERPTVTGLALHLGFASKQSLYDYEKEDKFSYPIKKSLTRIENALERKLDGQAVTGVIFALKNMGWKDKHETEHSGELGLKQITGMEIL